MMGLLLIIGMVILVYIFISLGAKSTMTMYNELLEKENLNKK